MGSPPASPQPGHNKKMNLEERNRMNATHTDLNGRNNPFDVLPTEILDQTSNSKLNVDIPSDEEMDKINYQTGESMVSHVGHNKETVKTDSIAN